MSKFTLFSKRTLLTIVGYDIENNDLTYDISGTVNVYGSGDALADLTINLTGDETSSTTTDSAGDFSFTAQHNGTYTAIPYSAAYTFNPVSTVVKIDGENVININFVATATGGADTYSISGTITGDVQDGVKITLKGTQEGTAITKSDGTYTFENLIDGGTFIVTPFRSGYLFVPVTEGVTISGANVTIDLVATSE